jgi:adenylate cyclase
MNTDIVSRRLAAIVIADVVGYSRHMERDDTGTFARLRLIRDEVVDPAIVSHGGRIVKTAGDGLLAEFTSVLAALRASIQIQRQMAARNHDLPTDERVDYRIGVNLGDIIVDTNDIAGDGVNVASRLESMAEPGGICVSSAVREQIHGKLDVHFIDIGEQQVRNIVRPIRIYQVRLEGLATPPVGARRFRSRSGRQGRWLVAGATSALVAVAAIWLLLPLYRPSRASADLPPPMSIAILPFAAASESAADRQYAEQLTNDITTNMGRVRESTVAAPTQALAFTGKTIDLSSVGRQLNVRYIAEGEIRRMGEKLAVTVRLTEARTRKQSWSDRRDFDATALMTNPDVVQMQLTRRLISALTNTEIQRAAHGTASAEPIDLVLRGYAAQSAEPGVNGVREARKQFEAALRLDPNLVLALSDSVWSYSDELQFGPNPERKVFQQKMDALSGRAVSIDPQDGAAWAARSAALGWLGRWDEALSANERTESFYPWGAGVLVWRAWIMISMGRPDDALAAAQRAVTIDPPGGGDPQLLTCKSYLYLGRYDDAVAACEKSAGLNNSWVDQVYLTAAYAQKGDLTKARIAREELLKLQPGYTIERYRQTWYSGSQAFFDLVEKHLAAGLRKAGIPER